MPTAQRISRVQRKGQVTIPAEIRQKLGLKEGDLVAFVETDDGVLISPQEMVDLKALDQIEKMLKEKGITLEQLMADAGQAAESRGEATPGGPGLLEFLTRVQKGSVETAEGREAPEAVRTGGKSVAEMTFGAVEPRQRPEDFKALRQQFIDDVVEDSIAESSRQ